ncbi:histidine triad nucleotide-binding protein 3 [Galendromus occidentalis]|uniref:Adenosine 5'-monophosphoramidase HINT3 n=1 Tax=Galendromus occidentalis TaxID=34638 RepID=A0AAJ6QR22_9ACAR|nr:histidine triad nucleotide-binding protein 3 [Galendromus occidentalis]
MGDAPSDESFFGRFLTKLLSVLRWGQSPECIFCKIAAGNDPSAEIHYHDSNYVVITDIAPASKHHYLVIPKEHIRDMKCLDDMHIEMVNDMLRIGKQVLESRGGKWEHCRNGFHNPPFISVSHLHMHIISPESEMSTRMDLTFRPDSYWFKTTETLLGILDRMKPPVSQVQSPIDELGDLR